MIMMHAFFPDCAGFVNAGLQKIIPITNKQGAFLSGQATFLIIYQ